MRGVDQQELHVLTSAYELRARLTVVVRQHLDEPPYQGEGNADVNTLLSYAALEAPDASTTSARTGDSHAVDDIGGGLFSV